MVKVDFTRYKCFATCPTWWQNFVTITIGDARSYCTTAYRLRDELLASGINKFNGKIIDLDTEDVEWLEFETEEDFEAFKLIWSLHGNK